jgi:hypothetical protein
MIKCANSLDLVDKHYWCILWLASAHKFMVFTDSLKFHKLKNHIIPCKNDAKFYESTLTVKENKHCG